MHPFFHQDRRRDVCRFQAQNALELRVGNDHHAKQHVVRVGIPFPFDSPAKQRMSYGCPWSKEACSVRLQRPFTDEQSVSLLVVLRLASRVRTMPEVQ